MFVQRKTYGFGSNHVISYMISSCFLLGTGFNRYQYSFLFVIVVQAWHDFWMKRIWYMVVMRCCKTEA